MQQFFRLANGLSSPALLIGIVWGVLLICVAIGPIDYPMQPSPTALVTVAAGVSLFVLAYWVGTRSFSGWFERYANAQGSSRLILNRVVLSTSLLGLAGIGLVALDRMALSGVNNAEYAELLRCAPGLVDFIEIKRTPLLYVGYLTFSFGFASPVTFLLKGEEIKGWAAILAQLSILSPVGYAVLYSGRMPILFVIVLIVSAMLVRIAQGKRPLPKGHHLVFKIAAVLLLFLVYSSAMWASRKNFCVQMSGLILELQQRAHELDLEKQPVGVTPRISASDLSKIVTEEAGQQAPISAEVRGLLTTMQESWHVRPRAYVVRAIDSGGLSPNTAMSLLSTYFYLTHGVRVMDTVWRERTQFSRHWGLYEIGILSPIFRIFLPRDQRLADMERQLKSTEIYGFFRRSGRLPLSTSVSRAPSSMWRSGDLRQAGALFARNVPVS